MMASCRLCGRVVDYVVDEPSSVDQLGQSSYYRQQVNTPLTCSAYVQHIQIVIYYSDTHGLGQDT